MNENTLSTLPEANQSRQDDGSHDQGSPKELHAPGTPITGGKNAACYGKQSGTIEIELTQGKVAIIDEEDWRMAKRHRWYAAGRNGNYYARNDIFSLHRMILGFHRTGLIDHSNHNSLDNRRKNLRFASPSENTRNQLIRRDNSTGMKGVCKSRRSIKFRAQIRVDGIKMHLGSLKTKEEAHEAYKQAAIKYHGKFASF